VSVSKRYKGKKITAKDKNWSKGTWYVWKRLNGKIIHKAIPEAQTKEQAEIAERKIIEEAFNRRYGVADNTTFNAFGLDVYTRFVEQNNVNRTAKHLYIRRLCGYFKGKCLADISPQDCRDAQSKFLKTTSASSVNRIMSTASRLFTLACEEGILDRNPMQFVKNLKEPPPRNRLLTQKERENLWLQLEKDPLMLRLVILATNLPLRRGQLLALTPNAIDLDGGLLIAKPSKGREARPIPLNATALHTIRQMIADGQLPFPLKDFRKRWNRIMVAAGINKKGGKRGENFTFHDLRHYLASELVNKHNVNPETVRKLFGHSDMSITQIYMNADFDTLKTALNTLDEVQESEVVQ
jgi:integrase